MLGGGASMVIASMASWFTPNVLFCVLNLMIGTIFIASKYFKSPHNHRQNLHGQLARSPSLLERVKSVNLSSFYATPESHDLYLYGVQSETTGYNSMSQLSRAPSLLERVKSIDFSFSSFYITPPDQSHDSHQHESEQTHYDSPSQLAGVPSLLERVKSFKVPSPFNSDHQSGDTFSNQLQHSDADPRHDPVQDHNVTSGKSKNSNVTQVKKSSSNITKSRSEKRMPVPDDVEEDVYKRRPATMKALIGEKDKSVDAKAEDFINMFKQQLKLQRLESLRRFNEMLNRGTSSA